MGKRLKKTLLKERIHEEEASAKVLHCGVLGDKTNRGKGSFWRKGNYQVIDAGMRCTPHVFWRFVHKTLVATPIIHDEVARQDHGIFRDGSKEISEAQNSLYKRTLLQDLNRQGAVVLEGKTLDMEMEQPRTAAEILARRKQESDGVIEEERRNRISMTPIEDLQTQDNHPYAPLCIKDPRDYFDSQQVNAVNTLDDSQAGMEQMTCSLGSEEAYGTLRASISKIKATGLRDPLFSPEVALKVLNGLTKNISSSKYHLGKSPQESVLDILPNTIKEKLLDHWVCSQELLRHFWSSYPITTQNLMSKTKRLKDSISQIYSKLEEIKVSAKSDLRHHVSLVVHPMQQALDAALLHYEADVRKRNARGSKPNEKQGKNTGRWLVPKRKKDERCQEKQYGEALTSRWGVVRLRPSHLSLAIPGKVGSVGTCPIMMVRKSRNSHHHI
ncbi:putative RNA polymerase II transcription factor B subunit 1-1, partial [Mucuna pruriens]